MTIIMPAKLALTDRIPPPAGITAFSVTEPVGRVLAAMCAQADCLIAWNGSITHITPLDARPSASAIMPSSVSTPMTRAQTLDHIRQRASQRLDHADIPSGQSAGDLPTQTLTADRRARATIQGTQP